MKQLLNPTVISIGFDLAKDIWQLLHDARHPDHSSKIVENIKNQLLNIIHDSQMNQEQPIEKIDS